MTSAQNHFDKLSAKKQIERLKKLDNLIIYSFKTGVGTGRGWEIRQTSINGRGRVFYCYSTKDLKALADKLEKENQ